MDDSVKGLVTIEGKQPVDETVRRIEALLEEKKVKLFAVVDHSGEARAAGLEMRPTKLLIFGNPSAGTPLMAAAPSAAIDLPLKLLVAEDADGRTWISYNSADYLIGRHRLPAALAANIAVIEALAKEAAK